MSAVAGVASDLPEAVRTDLATYAGRAAALDRSGVMRLQAGGGVLAATVRARAGAGLLGRGTILGLRAMAVPVGVHVDLVVALEDVRRSLPAGVEPSPIGPAGRGGAWVGLAPPRTGWVRMGEVEVGSSGWVELLAATAAVSADPDQAGAAASALIALGFLGSDPAARPDRASDSDPDSGPDPAPGRDPSSGADRRVVTAYRHGPWTRLAAPAGHLLMR